MGSGSTSRHAGLVRIDDHDLRELRERTSAKWRFYGRDVLPAWVAEMDFELAEPIAQALHEAVDRSDTGYRWTDEVPTALAEFAGATWNWQIDTESVFVLADVMSAITQALAHLTDPGAQVVINPPVYPPFFSTVSQVSGRVVREVPLRAKEGGYRLDLDALDAAFADPQVQAYLLCSPHNPTGTVHSIEELQVIADSARRHDVVVISDEIHAPLALPGVRHRPFLAIVNDFPGLRAAACVSASKAWNIPGLKCAQLVATENVVAPLRELIPLEATFGVGHFGVIGTLAAYRDGGPWLAEAISVLDARRTQLREGLSRIGAISMTWPQASYLGWIKAPTLGEDPAALLLEEAKLAVNSGVPFGTGGSEHMRINYATSEAIVDEIIVRIGAVIDAHAS